MSMDEILRRPFSQWMEGTGPSADIVLSSRVRLARNIDELPFPHRMSEEQGKQVLDVVGEAVARINRSRELGKLEMTPLASLTPLDRQVLVEKHLISPQLAQDARHAGVILRQDESISVMVNEEDHLRIQCLCSGLQLEEAHALAGRVDDALEQTVGYAFDEQRGYLTACPTNVGTALRASVMMHLPALVMTNQIGRVLTAISQLGLAVRGLYGEGTEAIGNIFQISNQITLGQTEEDIIANLKGVTRQIIDQERAARDALLKGTRDQLEDRVCRAYGLLGNARIMSSEEAMRLLSDVRLGIDLGLLPNLAPRALNELLVVTRPGFLHKLANQELTPFERDLKRASLIRERLRAG